MKIKLMYFGVIAEKAMKENEFLEFDDQLTSSDLKQILENKYDLKGLPFSMAINKEIKTSIQLKNDDEVALLPPFAGG